MVETPRVAVVIHMARSPNKIQGMRQRQPGPFLVSLGEICESELPLELRGQASGTYLNDEVAGLDSGRWGYDYSGDGATNRNRDC